MKKNLPIIILTAILAVCIVALVVVCLLTNSYNDENPAETTDDQYSSSNNTPIITIAAEVIKEYTIVTVDENGVETRLTFTRTEIEKEEAETTEEETAESDEDTVSAIWEWKDKTDFPLNASKFNSIEELLFKFTPTNKILNVTDEQLKEFGLDSPEFSVIITIDNKTQSERIFRIGRQNTYNSGYYLLDESTPEDVYIISETSRNTLYCELFSLANMTPFETVYEDLMQSLTIENSDKKIVCSYYPSELKSGEMDRFNTNWWISIDEGNEIPLDSAISYNLAALLKDMEFLECHSYTDEEVISHGIDPENPTVLTFVYTNNLEGNRDETNTVKLWLGNKEEKYGYYYACFPDTNVVFTLGGAAYSRLFEYSEEQLFSMNIADINYNTVESLVIKDSKREISIVTDHTENQGTLYTINGVKGQTYTDFSSFVNALKLFRATYNLAVAGDDTPVRDESISADTVFTMDFVFSDSEETHTLTVSRFNKDYNLVSFMGKETLLVTVDMTNALVDEYVEIKAK